MRSATALRHSQVARSIYAAFICAAPPSHMATRLSLRQGIL